MQNTVYVIGAGASKEVGLPTGDELKSKISNLIDIRFDKWGDKQVSGDMIIKDSLFLYVKNENSKLFQNIDSYLPEAWNIRDATPLAISIDNLLDAHRGNEKLILCGKLAIVRAILEEEKRSFLYYKNFSENPRIDFKNLETHHTWYIEFFKLLTENCKVEELEERFKFVTLIIFNYDRCVEHFLSYAIQLYYKIGIQEAVRIVKNIKIYHPYGKVGNLPLFSGENVMDFGATPNSKQLLELSFKIKTFTEGTDTKSSEIIGIRKAMANTDRLVFLGFAFHKLNMQLIKPELVDLPKKKIVKCYATSLGVSINDDFIVEEEIKKLFNGAVKVNFLKSKCYEFFSEFWRSLSF